MNKFLIITDTHLDTDIKETTLKLFKEVCDYAKQNDIKTLIHLGDFFNSRKHISISLIPIIQEICDMLYDTFETSFIIAGNHDSFYNDSLDILSISLLKPYGRIEIVDEPFQIDKDVILLPWLSDSKILKRYSSYSHIMGHFDINNVILNRSGNISKKCSLNQSDFSNFKTVFSGHFHTPGEYGNIRYLGSPYHTSFNDAGARGYYVWDKNSLDFIEFKGYNKFIIINQDSELKDITDNNVRVDFTRKLSVSEMDELLKKISDLKPKSLKTKFCITDGIDTIKESLNTESLIDKKKLLLTYFEKDVIPEHINKKVLESFIAYLIEEK